MNTHLWSCATVLTTLTSAALLAVPAEARSVPAIAGRARSSANAGCIDGSQRGTLVNGCHRTVEIEVPLVADGAPFDNYAVTVAGRGEDSKTTMTCQAFGFRNEGGTVWWHPSAIGTLPQLGVTSEFTMWTGVPPGGALIVDCLLDDGATLVYVNW